jgi:hypothetical protein
MIRDFLIGLMAALLFLPAWPGNPPDPHQQFSIALAQMH